MMRPLILVMMMMLTTTTADDAAPLLLLDMGGLCGLEVAKNFPEGSVLKAVSHGVSRTGNLASVHNLKIIKDVDGCSPEFHKNGLLGKSFEKILIYSTKEIAGDIRVLTRIQVDLALVTEYTTDTVEEAFDLAFSSYCSCSRHYDEMNGRLPDEFYCVGYDLSKATEISCDAPPAFP